MYQPLRYSKNRTLSEQGWDRVWAALPDFANPDYVSEDGERWQLMGEGTQGDHTFRHRDYEGARKYISILSEPDDFLNHTAS